MAISRRHHAVSHHRSVTHRASATHHGRGRTVKHVVHHGVHVHRGKKGTTVHHVVSHHRVYKTHKAVGAAGAHRRRAVHHRRRAIGAFL